MLFGLTVFLTGCFKDNNVNQIAQENTTLNNYLSSLRRTLRNSIGNAAFPRLDTTIYLVKDTFSFYKSNNYYFYYVRIDSGVSKIIQKPSPHDFVYVNITCSLTDGTIIETNNHTLAASHNIYPSNYFSKPLYIHIDSLPIAGLIECIPQMKLGSTYKFIIPSPLACGAYGALQYYTNNAIPAYSTLIYDIQLTNIVKDPIAYNSTFIYKMVDSLKLIKVSNDLGKVFLNSDTSTSDFALNDQVKVLYQGKILDGNYYFTDSASIIDSVTFTIGQNRVISGLELAVLNMKNNSSTDLVVPYNMAYEWGLVNSYGQMVIPRYQSLYFKLFKVVKLSN